MTHIPTISSAEKIEIPKSAKFGLIPTVTLKVGETIELLSVDNRFGDLRTRIKVVDVNVPDTNRPLEKTVKLKIESDNGLIGIRPKVYGAFNPELVKVPLPEVTVNSIRRIGQDLYNTEPLVLQKENTSIYSIKAEVLNNTGDVKLTIYSHENNNRRTIALPYSELRLPEVSEQPSLTSQEKLEGFAAIPPGVKIIYHGDSKTDKALFQAIKQSHPDAVYIEEGK